MRRKPPRGLFVTGTNTEVGKTYVTALIAAAVRRSGHRVAAYKPAASGCRQVAGQLVSDDALALWEACGREGELERVCPQLFRAPLAPHLAARAEGRQLDEAGLRSGLTYWTDRCDIVLVEGAGGLMSPLGEDEYVADLAHDLGYPLLVVAADQLGVINQTLQTLIAAATFRDGLDVAGVILNQCRSGGDPSRSDNLHELRRRCVPPVLARVDYGQDRLDGVDWFALAGGD